MMFESQRILLASKQQHGDLRKRDDATMMSALVSDRDREDAAKARVNLNRLPRFLFFTNGFSLKPASSDFCGGDLLGGKKFTFCSNQTKKF